GAVVWKYPVSALSIPAIARGVLYVCDYLHSNVYALNANTGALIWTYSEEFYFPSSLVVANGVVYVSGTLGGTVKALDAGSGELLWNSPQASEDSSELTVVNGMIYFASSGEDGGESYFYAYSLN